MMTTGTTDSADLQRLMAKGAAYLGSRLAITGGAMTWLSGVGLTAALSEAGAFGVLACGAMKPEELEAKLTELRGRCPKPFGVNLIVLHPQLAELVRICIAGHKASPKNFRHVVFAGGKPPRSLMQELRAADIEVAAFAPSLPLAKRFVASGATALIIEGSEAGGHIGHCSTFVLAQEILPHADELAVPIFAGGGVAGGEGMLALLEMGASGVQIGTLFAVAAESPAHADFKRALINANARDAKVSVQLDKRLPVIPVRAVANEASAKFLTHQKKVLAELDGGKDIGEARLDVEHFWAGSLKKAVLEGDVKNGSLMAGQSVGAVTASLKVAEIINNLLGEAESALARRRGR